MWTIQTKLITQSSEQIFVQFKQIGKRVPIVDKEIHRAIAIVNYTEDDVVSSDCIGDYCPCTFDAKAGLMLTPTFAKLIAWYDNEMSYTYQLLSLIWYMYSIG